MNNTLAPKRSIPSGTQKMAARFALAATLFSLAAIPHLRAMNEPKALLFTGTYSSGDHSGIFMFWFDQHTGTLEPAGKSPNINSPSFLALHPTAPVLYAVSEDWANKDGEVLALTIQQAPPRLTILNREKTGGQGPCHLAVDPDGGFLVCANYGGGTLSALPLDPNGSLNPLSFRAQHEGTGPNSTRQEAPHPHCVTFTPQNDAVLITDLGIDQVLAYTILPNRTGLAPTPKIFAQTTPGAGPRHCAFHPKTGLLYVLSELDSTITAFEPAPATLPLKPVQSVKTIPADFTENNQTAEIAVSPDSRFVYASNRGHNSIVRFDINQANGRLSNPTFQREGIAWPRHFQFSPNHKFLLVANRNTDSITVFNINPSTGSLTPTGQSASAPSPVCLLFAPPQP